MLDDRQKPTVERMLAILNAARNKVVTSQLDRVVYQRGPVRAKCEAHS